MLMHICMCGCSASLTIRPVSDVIDEQGGPSVGSLLQYLDTVLIHVWSTLTTLLLGCLTAVAIASCVYISHWLCYPAEYSI
jgi:hypothetical protein